MGLERTVNKEIVCEGHSDCTHPYIRYVWTDPMVDVFACDICEHKEILRGDQRGRYPPHAYVRLDDGTKATYTHRADVNGELVYLSDDEISIIDLDKYNRPNLKSILH